MQITYHHSTDESGANLFDSVGSSSECLMKSTKCWSLVFKSALTAGTDRQDERTSRGAARASRASGSFPSTMTGKRRESRGGGEG